jgi:hypothetical protein
MLDQCAAHSDLLLAVTKAKDVALRADTYVESVHSEAIALREDLRELKAWLGKEIAGMKEFMREQLAPAKKTRSKSRNIRVVA